MLGVLACPNLPLTSIAIPDEHSSQKQVGCLFSAKIGDGAFMQSLNGSSPTKVNVLYCLCLLFNLLQAFYHCLTILTSLQIHVSAIENSEDASFFESFEAAHSMHDLSSAIAEVLHTGTPFCPNSERSNI